jgi:hypothetical protein
MSRDNYRGIPKFVPTLLDKDGGIYDATKGRQHFMMTGSGTLVNGYTVITDDDISFHSICLITVASGSGTNPTTSGICYHLDAVNNKIHFSGYGRADGRTFSYCIFNPGIGNSKLV